MEKVQNNVQEAGSAEMVAFWIKDQFNLAMDSLSQKRVLFESGFSTGKTIMMMHCIYKLLVNKEKVLFVIHDDYWKKIIAKNCPSLLKIKIENHFEQIHQAGHFPDPQLFKILEVDLSEQKDFDVLCQKYLDFHFFIDEIKFRRGGISSAFKNKINWDRGVSPDLLKHWSQNIPQDKHLWLAICYNKIGFDSSHLDSCYPKRPEMINPVRNVEDTVKYVKSKKYLTSAMSGGGSSGMASASVLNDTSKFDEIDMLNIPTNLNRSFSPMTFQAKNYK